MKKVVLVTGASSGIGLETALLFIKEGYAVYGAARRIERMKKISESGGNVLPLDLCDEMSMISCVKSVVEKEGRIDVLVNNAGYGLGGAIEDVPMEEAKKEFDVNVFGLAKMVSLVMPYMRSQKSGRIINMSSMSGIFSSPFTGWYHASKYSVEALSDALRLEAKPFGIKVSVIEPGQILTDWGSIHSGNIRKFSGSSSYSENAERAAKWYDMVYSEKGGLSNPIVVAKSILKAAKSKCPKTRYPVGKNARLNITVRHLVSDRIFDMMTLKSMKLKDRM